MGAEDEGLRWSYVPPVLPEMVAAAPRISSEGLSEACAFAAHPQPARPAGELDVDAMLRSLGLDVDAVEVQSTVPAGVQEKDLDAFLDTCLGDAQVLGAGEDIDRFVQHVEPFQL